MLVPLTTSLTTLEDTVQNDLEAFEDRKTCIKCGIQVRTIIIHPYFTTPHGLPDGPAYSLRPALARHPHSSCMLMYAYRLLAITYKTEAASARGGTSSWSATGTRLLEATSR